MGVKIVVALLVLGIASVVHGQSALQEMVKHGRHERTLGDPPLSVFICG